MSAPQSTLAVAYLWKPWGWMTGLLLPGVDAGNLRFYWPSEGARLICGPYPWAEV